MQAMKLPKWVILQLERLLRAFLWKGQSECKPGSCQISWRKAALPTANGGLGIKNIQTQNDALLLKNLWKLDNDEDSLWSYFIRLLYRTSNVAQLEEVHPQRLSFFMTEIRDLLPAYNTSTSRRTPNEVTWRWDNKDTFSSKSAYNFLINPGKKYEWQRALWTIKAPPNIKFFLWLCCHNRANTTDILRKKGWPHNDKCSLCNVTLETRDHLFMDCSFTNATRRLAQRYASIDIATTAGPDFIASWLSKRKLLSKEARKKWEALWAAITWHIWKERNNRIFNNLKRPPLVVAKKALEDANLWIADC
ncbi:hypothetical protein LUZ60_001488 [Juncus effusus]|nr:hypothetical protein LUZ60_001488 [Juncus effusus]